MRSLGLAILALAFVFPATPAAGHGGGGDGLIHVNPFPLQLDPGANRTIAIETGEGPWRAGMVFILYVQFFNESRDLEVELLFEDVLPITTWNFTGEKFHRVSTRIPLDDGPYDLRFANHAETQTQLYFFFDQTCDCTAKPIPLDEGWVVFHYNLRAGREYSIGFPLIPEWQVSAEHMLLETETAVYPEDFRLLENQTRSGPEWLNFTVRPETDGTHYFFLTAHEGAPLMPDPRVYVDITVFLEERGGDESPGVGILAAVLGTLAGAYAFRRRS